MNTEETNTAITQRFMDALVAMKQNGNIKNFAEVYRVIGIDKGNFSKQMKDPSRGMLRPSWLALLVERYNISATWLLTGHGGMYSKREKLAHNSYATKCTTPNV